MPDRDFLKCAEYYLSDGLADPAHYTTTRWDGKRPYINRILKDFYDHLVDKTKNPKKYYNNEGSKGTWEFSTKWSRPMWDSTHTQDYSQLVDLCHCYPFVKWTGGKSQILSELDSIVPSQFNRYFETFLGGGAMFFHLVSDRNMRFTAYLSDINQELITAIKL